MTSNRRRAKPVPKTVRKLGYKQDYACAVVAHVANKWQVLLTEPRHSSAFVRVLFLCAGECPAYVTEIVDKVVQMWDSEVPVLRRALRDPARLRALIHEHVDPAAMDKKRRPAKDTPAFLCLVTALLDTSIAASRSHPRWRLPGGKPEVGEEGWDTAIREFEEETGVPRHWLARVPGGEFCLGFTTIFVTQIVNAEAREPVVDLDVGECTGQVRFMRSVPKTSILAEKLEQLWCNLAKCKDKVAAPLHVDPRLAKEKWTTGRVVEADGCLVLTP